MELEKAIRRELNWWLKAILIYTAVFVLILARFETREVVDEQGLIELTAKMNLRIDSLQNFVDTTLDFKPKRNGEIFKKD